MDYLPIFMNMRGETALIVGGGVLASRKAALVANSGAGLKIVSPEMSDAMRTLAAKSGAELIERPFCDTDIAGTQLVIAATDDAAVNHRVHRAARDRGLPVNVVDTPDLCTFILPAIVDRSPVVVAVSTGGRSPVLARFTKALLERALPAGLGRLAAWSGRWRQAFKDRVRDGGQRRRAWETVFESEIPELVYAGRAQAADQQVEQLLNRGGESIPKTGAVYLIGAGPGDAGLMTLRGQRLLQRADVVLYDRLVSNDVLELCRREAELIYVGKQHNDHPVPQPEITRLLIEHARSGKRVARLKGGDPFVFGRGGEEMTALADEAIDFQVVPGISSANGCAAYSGIPLTHRDHAQGYSCWTGHLKKGELELDWDLIAQSRHTQVFFMGLRAAATIGRELEAHGMAPSTPAALISAGTTGQQRVLRTSLRRLGRDARTMDVDLPTLIVVGSVVNLRRSLSWFEGSAGGAAVFPRHGAGGLPAAHG